MKTPSLLKKIAVIVMSLLLASGEAVCVFAAGTVDTGVNLRDPFVLEHGGTYYMYGTGLVSDGYGCVYGSDLKNWSAPVKVFDPPAGFSADGNWWAPECHFYNGAFYLFATYHSAVSGKRGVGIFRSSSPLGPFENISDGHITPADHDAIDGTLYVDGDGQPWMIYVGEWTSNADGVGDMMAAKLSADLSSFVSEPVLLFRASDADWSKVRITDGPFLYRTSSGRLIMLWSSMDADGYCVGIAYSSNGSPDGKWRQQPWLLYKKTGSRPDGGHGMLFRGPDGGLTLSIHSPNAPADGKAETAVFLPVTDIGDTLVLSEENTFFERLKRRLFYLFADIRAFFDNISF